MDKKRKVVVVGGGAAGLIAAIVAARNGAEVIILERMNRVGKKILATGNGRCNLTNIHMDIKRFHGKNPKFAYGALKNFDVSQTIQFFEQLGIAHKVEEGGKVFPCSDQASSVLDVLRYELETLGVHEKCEVQVKKIQKRKKGFLLFLEGGEKVTADKVIVTAGGKSAPKLGSNGSGYDLVQAFGHKTVEPFPSLVQMTLDAWFLKRLKGVKFIGEAAIVSEGKVMRKEKGELLFTDYGISGPPILQLSRKVGEVRNRNKKAWIHIDMFPEMSLEQIDMMFQTRFAYQFEKTVEFSFIGLLNKKLIPVILKEAGTEDLSKPCSQIGTKERERIVHIFKQWKIPVKGTQSWMHSQATAGGIDVKDIDPKTMESKLVPGLYFAGEVMDIDGDCGGFNLQWAWSSGYIAGESAVLI